MHKQDFRRALDLDFLGCHLFGPAIFAVKFVLLVKQLFKVEPPDTVAETRVLLNIQAQVVHGLAPGGMRLALEAGEIVLQLASELLFDKTGLTKFLALFVYAVE